MAQRYPAGPAHERMAHGLCPECGGLPREHSEDTRFWIPRNCDLLPTGVSDRIAQYEADTKENT